MVLSENIVTALYIAASVLFILSLGGLSGQESAPVSVPISSSVVQPRKYSEIIT